MTVKRTPNGQARTLFAEIVRLRCEAHPGQPALSLRAGRADRLLIELARDLGVHVAWHEEVPSMAPAPTSEDPAPASWQCACVCGWRGMPSDDLAERACEIVEHVMARENFAVQ